MSRSSGVFGLGTSPARPRPTPLQWAKLHDLAGSERDRPQTMWRLLAAAWDLDYQEPP